MTEQCTAAYDRSRRDSALGAWEAAGLGTLLVVLLAISVANLSANRFWEPDAPPHAPWCTVGQTPTFRFGFAALAQAIGNSMGVPIECEHPDGSTSNILQATTTGVAVYYWCTNTPSFTRGQEHWMVTPEGVEHWTGDADRPRLLRIVRPPDLRHLCSA